MIGHSERSEESHPVDICCVALALLSLFFGRTVCCSAADSTKPIPIDDPQIVLAPYVWKCTGQGPTARAEATLPGAYLKLVFQGSPSVGLLIDGTPNVGCPAASMPVVEWSMDHGPYVISQLKKAGECYVLPLAKGFDPAVPHSVEVYFRAADLAQKRWQSPVDHLHLAGIVLDTGGTLRPCPPRAKRAIGFGDSITEGVGVDGYFTSWQVLEVNNARATWFPIACAALGCEYGQLGSGGQGMVNPSLALPPLPQAWDHYDAVASRLTDGKLQPEPDYVLCMMGTNDGSSDITKPYTNWLAAARRAGPTSRIFCIVSPLGYHANEIGAAVAARNKSGDPRVYLVDTAPLRDAFRPGIPTQLAYDGVHPSVYGQAMLGALVAVEIQKVLSREKARY
jgi:hypothetical protein